MIVIVMGVCGSGKTTIGKKLAQKLECPFADADDYHPDSNKEKMSSGIPLTDDDRLPWLQALHLLTVKWSMEGGDGVLTCSALKRTYRNILRHGRPEEQATGIRKDIMIVYLQGSYELFDSYLSERKGHFMPAGLLRSQMDTLEEPTNEKDCLVVDASKTVEETLNTAMAQLKK